MAPALAGDRPPAEAGATLLVAVLVLACGTAPPKPLAVIPFEFVKNQILIPVTIGGRGPYAMILDTAVTPSAVNLDLARELNLPVDTSKSGEASGAGSGPGLTTYDSAIPKLVVGGFDAGEIDALAADVSPFAKPLGRPLDGILGQSFLDGRVVEIDYAARTVRIYPPNTSLPKYKDEVRLPMEFAADDDKTPIIPLAVNGRTIPVTLDTGSSRTLVIYADAVSELGLDKVRESATASEGLGARGVNRVVEADIDSLAVGSLVVDKPRVAFGPRNQDDTSRRKGNLGNGFLQHFVLTLDYPRREIRMRDSR